MKCDVCNGKMVERVNPQTGKVYYVCVACHSSKPK
jgi:hypothetical protein